MRLALLAVVVIVGCAPPRRAGLGTECERNTDCAAPLVCRVGFCRNECATSADCPAGLSCLLDGMPGDAHRFGACQLADEAMCTLQSECPEGLVCRFNQCTNACNEDRDCPGGARCELDPMGNACVDLSSAPCTLDSECAAGEFCLSGRCRQQCYADRDCRNGWWCDTVGGVCRSPIDGGPRDTMDSGSAGLDAPPGSCGSAPLTGVTGFSMGADQGCAIVLGSELFCWADPMGAFAGTVSTLCAEAYGGLSAGPLREVHAGLNATCVLTTAGTVECFGNNFYGELGRGAAGTPALDFAPAPVVGLVAARLYGGTSPRFFAVDTGGTIWGWGENSGGSLGDGSTMHRGAPVASTAYAGATTVASGTFTCALVGGSPTCRGGLPTSGPPSGQIGVAVGRNFACAHDATTVWCVAPDPASAVFGVTGDGGTVARATWGATSPFGGGATITALSAGDEHACALLSNREVWCWGARLAFDPTGADEAVPLPEQAVTNADALDCGLDSTCILRGDRVLCAGRYAHSLGQGFRGRPVGFSEVLLP